MSPADTRTRNTHDAADNDPPAVTGTPMSGEQARREAITGDDPGLAPDGGNVYPTDGVSPDRGGSAPRD